MANLIELEQTISFQRSQKIKIQTEKIKDCNALGGICGLVEISAWGVQISVQ